MTIRYHDRFSKHKVMSGLTYPNKSLTDICKLEKLNIYPNYATNVPKLNFVEFSSATLHCIIYTRLTFQKKKNLRRNVLSVAHPNNALYNYLKCQQKIFKNLGKHQPHKVKKKT